MRLEQYAELIGKAVVITDNVSRVNPILLIQLVQIDMLNIAKANTILSDSAEDLYKDLLAYVNENQIPLRP